MAKDFFMAWEECFDQQETFDLKEIKLWSFSSGLTTASGDGIIPEKAEVGFKIQRQLDEASIKRCDYIEPLVDLNRETMLTNKS